MVAKSYRPGEFAQAIFTDEHGNRFDERGNLLTDNREPASPDAVCYRTERGQYLKYALVYPGPVNVHQNVPLSDFAVAWEELNPGIAQKICPVLTVSKRSDLFYIIGQQGQETLRTPTDESDLRAVGAVANEVQNVFNTDTYLAVNRAYRDFLPDEVADSADEVLNLSQGITSFLMDKLEYRWDIRVIALAVSSLTNTASFQTACGTGGKHIGDSAQATPYTTYAINYAKNQVILANGIKPANTMLTGLDVAQAIATSPEVRPQVVYDLQGGYLKNAGFNDNVLTGGMPPQFAGVNQVVAYHTQNTAKKGQTNAFSAYLTNAFYLLHVGQPGRRTLNTLTTFRKGGIVTRTYRDESRRGQYIEVEMIQTEKATNIYGGYAITTAISS